MGDSSLGTGDNRANGAPLLALIRNHTEGNQRALRHAVSLTDRAMWEHGLDGFHGVFTQRCCARSEDPERAEVVLRHEFRAFHKHNVDRRDKRRHSDLETLDVLQHRRKRVAGHGDDGRAALESGQEHNPEAVNVVQGHNRQTHVVLGCGRAGLQRVVRRDGGHEVAVGNLDRLAETRRAGREQERACVVGVAFGLRSFGIVFFGNDFGKNRNGARGLEFASRGFVTCRFKVDMPTAQKLFESAGIDMQRSYSLDSGTVKWNILKGSRRAKMIISY